MNRVSDNYADGLEIRIKELIAERDALAAKLAGIEVQLTQAFVHTAKLALQEPVAYEIEATRFANGKQLTYDKPSNLPGYITYRPLYTAARHDSVFGDDVREHTSEQAADLLQSQAERIKELEAEASATKQQAQIWKMEASTQKATVQEIYQLCTGGTGEPGDWNGANPVRKLIGERDTLRAQLADIEKTEPVAEFFDNKPHWTQHGRITYTPDETKLFTRPMPALDVTELVDALEKLARLGNGEHYGNSDGNILARDALYRYKGAK